MAKHLKQQMSNAWAIMARLLLCLFLCSAGSGCLLPQDDQVIPELPPFKNRPPRIVARTPVDERVSVRTGPGLCIRPSFEVTVEDADTGDQLRSQWILDRSDSSFRYRGALVPADGNARRNVLAPTSGQFTSAMVNLTPGIHTLTVSVVDTDFDSTTDMATKTPKTLPDGTVVEDTGYVDETSWVLEVSPCQ